MAVGVYPPHSDGCPAGRMRELERGPCNCANLDGIRAAKERVEHPPHYTTHPSGVECITVVEHMPFNVGNAVKYLWRAGVKDPAKQIGGNVKTEAELIELKRYCEQTAPAKHVELIELIDEVLALRADLSAILGRMQALKSLVEGQLLVRGETLD